MHPNQLRAARAGLRMSQADLAARAGVHPKSLARWEGMNGPLPPQEASGTIAKLEAALRDAGARIEGQGVTFDGLG